MLYNLKLKNNLYYDYNAPSFYFNDNFKHIKDNVYLYRHNGELSEEFIEDDFYKINYKKSRKANIAMFKSQLSKLSNKQSLDELKHLLDNCNIVYSCKYETFEVKDVNNFYIVYINKEEFKKVFGKPLEYNLYSDCLKGLMYEAPIRGSITINFDYITVQDITYNFKHTFEVCDINYNKYNLKFNYDYIITIIRDNLVDYKLKTIDVEAIISLFNDI